MLYYFRWLSAIPFLLLFLWAALFNLRVVLLICRNAMTGERKRVPSFGPFIGGLAGVVGLYLCPLEGLSWRRWLPLVADAGSLPYFFLMLPLLLRLWISGDESK